MLVPSRFRGCCCTHSVVTFAACLRVGLQIDTVSSAEAVGLLRAFTVASLADLSRGTLNVSLAQVQSNMSNMTYSVSTFTTILLVGREVEANLSTLGLSLLLADTIAVLACLIITALLKLARGNARNN